MAKTARIEVRTDPGREALLKRAAALNNQTLSSFILDAAEQRAEQIVADASTTVVPAAFFDELLDALARPAVPNAALRTAARRLDQLVDRQ